MTSAFVNRLKVFRAERDWTQADLAERLGVSRQTIQALEKGRYDPSLPLAFRISRLFGQPIEAIEQDEELTFADWTADGGKFALRVTGESMIEEHIADGDYVVIKQQDQARDGQIVAVRDDDGEATLKKIYRERGRVRLEPANSAMRPIYRDHVDILGVLVGVVRKY